MNVINKRIIDGDSQLDKLVYISTQRVSSYTVSFNLMINKLFKKTGGDDVDDGGDVDDNDDGENENGNMQM